VGVLTLSICEETGAAARRGPAPEILRWRVLVDREADEVEQETRPEIGQSQLPGINPRRFAADRVE
jgi:hypothetical protein